MTFEEQTKNWLPFDDKDTLNDNLHILKDIYELGQKDTLKQAQKKIKEKDVIINFLKKELIHKTAYKNVMKKQYRELREKYDVVKPRVEFQRDLKLHKFAWFDVTEWSQEEAEGLVAKWKEIENRKKKK